MRYIKNSQLNCFSPPVMIATFAIEICLAVYVLWRYKLNDVTRLAAAILVLLGVFQLAEYNVCEGSFGMSSLEWSRIGYIAITMLPPLGFHLATKLAGQRKRIAVTAAYTTGLAFAAFFAFSGSGITSPMCLGNYVIFETAPGSSALYGLYYYSWLIVGTGYSLLQAFSGTIAKHKARALKALAVGYLAFILPTTTVNIVDPSTMAGIPSIMCGFAVIFALALAGEVLPQYFRQSAATDIIQSKGLLGGKTTK